MLEMFGLNCLRIRTKSLLIALTKYHIKGAQLVACLLIYVSHAYFYVIRNIPNTLHCLFTFLSVINKIHKFIDQHKYIV